MAQDPKSHDKVRTCPRYIPDLGIGCFAALFEMWFALDLNGHFMHIGARLTSLFAGIFSLVGYWANYIMFRRLPKHRLAAVLMGCFCMDCFLGVLRTLS